MDKLNSEEARAEAQKSAGFKRQDESDLARAYNRCFSTDEGKRVLADLAARFIYHSGPELANSNIEYRAAYMNGQSGVVRFIHTQNQRAEIL